MAFDPVPWFIQAPAEHSAEVARTLAYASVGGHEGIASAADWRVTALTPNGPGVRIMPGAGSILNRGSGGSGQMYMQRSGTATDLPVSPTGSSGKRSDLLIVRVNDPQYGGQAPANPAVGPYAEPEWITNVPATTTSVRQLPGYANVSAITLARLDLPANTAVVSAAMIKDLREVARPKRSEVVFARPRISSDDTAQRFLTATYANGGEYFPGGGGVPNEFQALVPEWATRMVIDSRWMMIEYGKDRRPTGRYWMEFGDEYREGTWPGKQQWEFATQHFGFNAPREAVGSTTEWSLMDEVAVPAKLRGKLVTFVFKAGVTNTPGANHTWMNALGGLGCRLTFAEQGLAADMI